MTAAILTPSLQGRLRLKWHLVVTPLLNRSFSGGLRRLEGKPCPQDVDGGVDVRVGRMAARPTPELRLADAVPCGDVPALGAALRGGMEVSVS